MVIGHLSLVIGQGKRDRTSYTTPHIKLPHLEKDGAWEFDWKIMNQ